MSFTTIPMDNGFNMVCKHCGDEKTKPPIGFIKKDQDLKIYTCNKCKSGTLIHNNDSYVVLYKIED